ncbi:MAG: RdgB/HAM1 family non-canonical purine NTP pyrophosphatase [Alphaproteobacteria bacterium]|nr:MAG: RdgB/HAM1 family non-canonical purine NTP pyrophosphatase [Alphaproteobacteria bacterium]
MGRKLRKGETLIVASHNPGKIAEIADLVRPFGLAVVSGPALGLPEPEETGDSFRANAALKALAAARGGRMPALADDSGLVVPALGGAPGIHSARWAGPDRDFKAAMTQVAHALDAKGVPAAERRACFVCVLALAWPDGHVETYQGRIDGRLVWPMRGDKGFGYDAIFKPDGQDLTFGEMDSEAKHAISHRARAFAQLVAACLE